MKKKNYSHRHPQDESISMRGKDYESIKSQIMLDAIQSMKGKKQFAEQKADAKDFFDKAIFNIG